MRLSEPFPIQLHTLFPVRHEIRREIRSRREEGIPPILEWTQHHRIADFLDGYGHSLKSELLGQPDRLALAVFKKLRLHV